MKKSKIAIIAFAISTAFISCKKEDDSKPSGITNGAVNINHNVSGKWVGNYGYDNDKPDIYYCFQIKGDGTLEEWNSLNKQSGVGTWTANTNQFLAKTHFLPPYTSIFKLNAALDTNNMTITGTWGYNPSTTNGGKFYLVKKSN